MLELVTDFKALGLHGMASAWPEVLGTARIKAMDHEAAYSTRWRTRFHADGGQCSSVMADTVPR